MKKLLAILFTLSIATFSFAQQRDLMEMTEMPQKASVKFEQPLVLVKGQATTASTLLLDESKIAKVDVFRKDIPEAKKYAAKGENGVALVTLKAGVDLVSYEQILDKFNIPADQRKLKVSINRGNLVNPELILADLSQIEKVEEVEAGAREFAQWGWNQGDKYLNIVTKKKE